MKSLHYRGARHGRRDGQALVLFLFFSIVLILFVGLGIDLGFAYITKAQLSKALDAASLAAVSNYSGADKGAAANLIAQNTFWANYATNGVSGRATGGAQVTPHGTFSTDANGNLIYSNTASAKINTFFIGLLPQWKTLTVGDTAVSTRYRVVMSLVLDRSGSMAPDCGGVCNGCSDGGTYLPPAVSQFISIFDETLDQAALVTFASSASNDVVMTHQFKTGTPNINSAVARINGTPAINLWTGGTCSIAGLTNALVINNSVIAPTSVKVVVFFTDGLADTSQGVFNGHALNFGRYLPPPPGCLIPATEFYLTNAPETSLGQNTTACTDTAGKPATCTAPGVSLTGVTQFTSSVDGKLHNFDFLDITADATNRCVLIANQMRAASNYVYAVGLNTQTIGGPNLETLQEIANDPASGKFDDTQPVGAAFLSNGNDLTEVFQQVAADIILRLVQ